MADRLDIRAQAHAVNSGTTRAVDLAAQALEAAEQSADLAAFLHLDRELVLRRAEHVDARIAAGETLPLAGVPIAIKDNICVSGEPMTCASRILEGYKPFYDATIIDRLVAAGAVVFGKTNMDEFAMGSSGENSAYGAARNPWNTARVPGGSSSGSAASVGAGIVPAALGSDTGGSIRQPAAFCGIVGFKPTYGRVSRRGLTAFGSSLDQIGPLTHSVSDAALVHGVMAGFDPLDSTSLQSPSDVGTEPLAAVSFAGLRIGVPHEAWAEGLDPEVEASFREALGRMKDAGATIVPLSLPTTPYAVATYYIAACAEASSNLARFDGVRFGHRTSAASGLREMYSRSRAEAFGPEVRRRILLGTYVLSAGYYDAYYRRAQQVRTLFVREFERSFEACDVIATPTAPSPAFEMGARTQDPLTMYLADIYTIPASLAGIPAISVPCGLSVGGLPIGLHLVAPAFEDARLFGIAAGYEALRGTFVRSPRAAATGAL